MRSSEFGKVIYQKIPFHMFVQVYDFLVVSAVVFGVAKALLATGILHEALSNGMIICSCLSMSVNAVIVLTSAANGNEAAAIFHSALGNIVGIFLSPVLIVAFLPGASSNVNLAMVFLDLTYKVLIPLIIGQVLRLSLKTVREFYTRHKKCFKKAQEYSLVFIV
jgi:sodium/bile acid cotransporter 7